MLDLLCRFDKRLSSPLNIEYVLHTNQDYQNRIERLNFTENPGYNPE